MNAAIVEIDCKRCIGKGHFFDEDGIKAICTKCEGLGRVCKCHGKALWKCPAKEDEL